MRKVTAVGKLGKLRVDQEVYYPGLKVKMYQVLKLIFGLSIKLYKNTWACVKLKRNTEDLAYNSCRHCLCS